jgi:hypothetical protein
MDQDILKKQPFRFPALDLVIWAETEDEAIILASQKNLDKKEERLEDLNKDGKFDEKDTTIASKTLNKAKNFKK